MKRTLLALLVGLSLLLSLAACGSERASAQEVTEQGLAALRDLDVLALPQYWNTDGLNLDDLGDLTQAGEEVDLSAEDTATYEKMEQEIVDLGREIERQERLDAFERELNTPVNTPITQKPDTAKVDTKTGRASDTYKK